MNHAIVNPPVDGHKRADEVGDVYVHVEKETDAGVIVSGAKVVGVTSYMSAIMRGITKQFALNRYLWRKKGAWQSR